jgi:NTP pyrophosphatase (non-canonical NTP hydrolase)
LLHGAIGIATEAGELLDALKKHIYYNKELDKVNISEEIGDVLWYAALLCNCLEIDMRDVMDTNIAKLKARYPEKFDEDKAENRNLKKERRVLEDLEYNG